MNKYIDAEKLKAEIDKLHDAPVPKHDQQCDFSDGYSWGLSDIENLIDSLQRDDTQVDKMLCSQTWWEEQGWIMIPPDATIKGIDSLLKQVRKKFQQEQPDCHTVEDWIQRIKNADQLTKDIFSKGPYDVLYDALNHPYQHCYDAIKEFGELCFQTGVNSVKQEHQEVDLEKEYKEYVEDDPVFSKLTNRNVGLRIAKHFYKLGFKARKEE